MAWGSNDYEVVLEKSYNTLHTYVSSGEWSIVKQKVKEVLIILCGACH